MTSLGPSNISTQLNETYFFIMCVTQKSFLMIKDLFYLQDSTILKGTSVKTITPNLKASKREFFLIHHKSHNGSQWKTEPDEHNNPTIIIAIIKIT